MTAAEALTKLETDPDWIMIRRFDHSLKKLEAQYPDGCPEHVVAAALGITEEQARERYIQIVEKLQKLMKVET